MAIKDTDRKARANYKKKTPVIRIELYGTDADIRDHLEGVKGAGVSVQGYIKELIRADIARVEAANTMLHRMQEDLQSGKISGVICSENGEAAIEHPAIIDRETYEAAQAVLKAENENQLEPQTNEEIKTGKTLGYFRVATAAQLERVPEEMPKPDSTPADVARYERKASSGQREEGIENQSQACQEYAQRSGFITEEEAKQ